MKIIKRILISILIMLLGIVILLPASVIFDAAAGDKRMDTVTNTTIPGQNGSPAVRAYVVKPQGAGPFPTVIMIHEFFGLNESIVGKAKGLAEEGYLVIAPDTFRGSTTAWIPRAIYQVITTKPEQINIDLDSIYTWLEAQPEVDASRIAVMGFCYGGRAALTYSLHNNRLAATVIFYGSPETDPQILKSLPGPVLGIFGGADTSIPLDEVRAFEAGLQQAGIPQTVTIYDGQPHAFVTSIEGIRAGGAQGQAWKLLLAFLDANLKQENNSSSHGEELLYSAPFDWGYYIRLVYEHTFGTASHMH